MKASRHSIVIRFVVLTAVIIAGLSGTGLWLGWSLLSDLARLRDHDAVREALEAGRDGLIERRNERQALVATLVDRCLSRGDAATCSFPELGVHLSEQRGALNEDMVPGWLDESHLVVMRPEGAVIVSLDWPLLKPRFELISEVLAMHEHLASVFPEIRRSFVLVFTVTIALACLIAFAATLWVSSRLKRRVDLLTNYARDIAACELKPAPRATQGRDEVGVLARSMHAMAEELARARERLVFAQKMSSWQTIARKVAHEIKNPLTPISLVAEQLGRSRASAPPALAEILDESARILLDETEALMRMVRSFTAFARLPDPQFERSDLTQIVSAFVRRNQQPGGPVLSFTNDATERWVEADRGMIMQVLHNLTNNAAQAAGTRPVHISFELAEAAEGYAVDVRDDGPGVPPEVRDQLFDAYVTSRSTGDREKGMGLGLTIARKIATDHRGHLSLIATGKGGSCFRLVLPPSEALLERGAERNPANMDDQS